MASVALDGAQPAERPDVRRPTERGAFARLRSSPAGAAGLVITGSLVLVAVLAPYVAPYDPIRQAPGLEMRPPTAQHLFGTDELGRDILSRVVYGTRVSLLVSLVAVTLGALVGISTGLAAGYLGGWVDDLLMRLYDSLLAFPAILLAIAVAAVLGPGAMNAAIALALVSMPQFSRLMRACVLTERDKEYVQAARAVGATPRRVVVAHILPNSLATVLVQLTLAAAYAVLLEASLSFLGLGTQPPDPSWGAMLSISRTYLQQAPWYGLFPGAAIALLLLGLNFLADGVHDALDPGRRSRASA